MTNDDLTGGTHRGESLALPIGEAIETDVVIVGAGPIGIELAAALKRGGVSYEQIEARNIGYTVSWFSPQTRWFSSNDRIAIAGVPLMTPDGGKATREQYLAYLRGVVTQFDLRIRCYEPVGAIHPLVGGGFAVVTRRGGKLAETRTRAVVLATGGTERPRRLGVPGEDAPHVSAYFGDPHHYFGQKLLIVGGRNSAAEAALRCHHAGASVTMSYRGASLPHRSIKYWLLPELQGLIDAGRIRAEYGTTVRAIGPRTTVLRRGEVDVEVEADFVLKLIGYEADMALFESAGARLRVGSLAPQYDADTMETSVKGLYVAGTAAGGTQESYELFLENCHVHIDRIVRHLAGGVAKVRPPTYAQPES